MAELKREELADLIENIGDKDSIKEAVQTLHPPRDKNSLTTPSDRLAIFNDEQIDAAAVLEWQDKALSMTCPEFEKENVTEGFVEKVKALTVSKEGQGRKEIPEVMKPQILGEMLQQGMMPMNSQPAIQGNKQSWLGRLFGKR